MSLGGKIRKQRLRAEKTQREVSKLTGLAISHLSRMENGRVVPSTRTLNRIAEALAVPVTSFFDAEPALEENDRCPVSLSGRCILDHAFLGRGRRPKFHVESYTAEQLETLRLCNYLLHSGDEEAVAALATVVRSLAGLAGYKRAKGPPRSGRG